eukprot:COSAG01_NODE_2686_length_7252_cov_3.534741_2_plen_59_part_00
MQVINNTNGGGTFPKRAVERLKKLCTDASVVLQASRLYGELKGLHDGRQTPSPPAFRS